MNYLLIEITVSPRSLDSLKLMTLDMIINQYRRLCLGYPFLYFFFDLLCSYTNLPKLDTPQNSDFPHPFITQGKFMSLS